MFVRSVFVRSVFAALTAAVLLAACGSSGGSSEATLMGSIRDPAPAVNLVTLPSVAAERDPVTFAFAAAPGEVLVVYFGYTSCPDVCPTTLADVAAARAMMGDDGDRVEVAMATIDPDRDTDEVLSSYVGSFVPDSVALRTEDDALLRAAADQFGVFYEVSTADDGTIEVLHSGTLFGVDDAGTLVVSWPFGTSPADLAHDFEILLNHQGDAVTYTYVIPNGTAERIEAGEPVQIVPARLDINIGDSIEIVNRDSQGHNVGPFFVGEGETVSQTFQSAAEYVDACSVHPSDEFTIVVS